jgi:hypothetical protein
MQQIKSFADKHLEIKVSLQPVPQLPHSIVRPFRVV